jgi:FkbM family methyltransferase
MISYAQNFEDVMLWRALGHIEKGFYIDIGAQHPVIDSVSKAFYEKGWRGISVEAIPEYAALLKADRPDEKIINAAVNDIHGTITFYEIPETGLSTGNIKIANEHKDCGFEVKEIIVPSITLSDLFVLAGEHDIHWLKIDVEGMELQVLKGWGNSDVYPWIIVIECTHPRTSIESYAQWEDILIQKSYKPVYFDGLNRFYLSSSQLEFKEAFRVAPNVFDGFSLNGTACSTFCSLIIERHKQNEQAWAKELTDAQAVINDKQFQTEELRTDFFHKLQILENEKNSISNTFLNELHAFAEREQICYQNLQYVQEKAYDREKEWSERDKSHTELLFQINQRHHAELTDLMRALNQRDQEFAEKHLQAIKSTEHMRFDLLAKHYEQEKLFRVEENALREKLDELISTLAQREQEFGAKQLEAHQTAEQERIEMSQVHTEQVKLISEQHSQLLERLRHEQSQQFQVQQQQFSDTLNTHQQFNEYLKAQLQKEQENRKQTQEVLASLQEQIGCIQSSFLWRITTPVRKLGIFWGAVTPQRKFQTLEFIPDLMPIEGLIIPKINQHTNVNIAKTTYELLSYHDEEFIHCAYLTLLGREPDTDGLIYYLKRLRTGYSKGNIITQMLKSKEGKTYNAKLYGLPELIAIQKKADHWFWKLFSRESRIELQVNRLESELGRIILNIQQKQDESMKHILKIYETVHDIQISINHLDMTIHTQPLSLRPEPESPKPMQEEKIQSDPFILTPRANKIFNQLKHAIGNSAENRSL